MMRYQINAILNSSAPDYDAIIRLLAESCEKLELNKLDQATPAKTGKRGGYRVSRYGRAVAMRFSSRPLPQKMRAQEEAFAKLLRNKFAGSSFDRHTARQYLYTVVPEKTRSSVSPVITRLLDQKILEVVDPSETK